MFASQRFAQQCAQFGGRTHLFKAMPAATMMFKPQL